MAMAGDISLAAPRRFRIPSQRVWKFPTKPGMPWRGAALGQPRVVTGVSPGNFLRDGVSQSMGLHLTDMAHGHELGMRWLVLRRLRLSLCVKQRKEFPRHREQVRNWAPGSDRREHGERHDTCGAFPCCRTRRRSGDRCAVPQRRLGSVCQAGAEIPEPSVDPRDTPPRQSH